MPITKSIITLFWVLAISFVTAGSSISAAKPTLNVGLENTVDKVVISTSANSPFSIGVFKSSSGRFLGFEFRGVLLKSGKLVTIRSGRIHNVKYASFQNSPPVSRIVVNTSSTPEYTLVVTPDKKQAMITIWKQTSQKRDPYPTTTQDEPVSNVTPDDSKDVARIDVPAARVALAAAAVKNSNKLPLLGEKVLANTEEVSDKLVVATKVKNSTSKSVGQIKAKAAPSAVVVKPKAVVRPEPVVVVVRAASESLKGARGSIVKTPSRTEIVKPKPVVRPRPVFQRTYTRLESRLSLSFSDAEVVDVLQALALQSRRNIVVSKAVGGKITLNLTSVTADQALNYVTKMSGYSFVKQGETYLVGTKSSLLGLATNDDLNIKIEAIMLSYASPNDVISILQSRFPDLKIRKSDTGWRMLKASSDISTVSVKTESKKAVGLTQTGQTQQSDQDGQSVSSSGSKLQGQQVSKGKQQGGIDESKQAQSGEDSESTTFTDEATGRGEQTRADSNMLIISGTDVVVEQAKLLINEMEKAVYTSSLENTFEIYRVKYVKADGLSEAIRQLVPGISVKRAPQSSGMDDKTEVIEGDPVRSGDKAIIVSGRQKDIQQALTIAARLDIVDKIDGRSDNVVELITVKNVSGDDVLNAITRHYPSLKVNLISVGVPKATANATTDEKIQNAAPTGNVMILSGPQDLIQEAKSLVAQMDSALQGALFLPEGNGNANPKQQIKLEKYEVRYVNAVELATALRSLIPAVTVTFAPSEGFDLSGPGPISISADTGATVTQMAKAPIQQVAEAGKEMVSQNVKTLLLLGPEADVKRAMELAPTLDIKSPQIKIVAKITSITENGEKKLGLTWDWGNLAYKEQTPLGAWIRDPINFGAKLEALYTDGDIQILATPSMTILEGKPGVFFVGDEITYITLIQQTATGQNVQTEKSLVGIQLRLNGRISSDGNITLNLHPEVSTLKLNDTTISGVTLPTISRRFTDQIVRVKDGETYVVGGLIRNDEVSDMNKIPLLGDLPFFGSFFRHSAKTKQRTEVVMFITATIVKD